MNTLKSVALAFVCALAVIMLWSNPANAGTLIRNSGTPSLTTVNVAAIVAPAIVEPTAVPAPGSRHGNGINSNSHADTPAIRPHLAGWAWWLIGLGIAGIVAYVISVCAPWLWWAVGRLVAWATANAVQIKNIISLATSCASAIATLWAIFRGHI